MNYVLTVEHELDRLTASEHLQREVIQDFVFEAEGDSPLIEAIRQCWLGADDADSARVIRNLVKAHFQSYACLIAEKTERDNRDPGDEQREAA